MQPKIYHTSDHDIDPSLIDSDAIYVINKLKDAGYTAYLVGGSVRDLLVKKTPKDFDISTSAKPEQIKQVFHRNCLLIGRRFRLAHIRFGHKIFEVSTFRSGDNESDLIVQDNQWGSPEEDVLRRDFTINGLYYDPSNHTIIDYVGGWEDIHKCVLRTIGNPAVRFKQDPVRMIRLLKFRARFGFEIERQALKELLYCRHEIVKSSPARILEEIFRMLESGFSAPFFQLMTESSLLELLFPSLTHFLESKSGSDIYNLLRLADSINISNDKKPLDRAIMTSCLLYPILENEIRISYLQDNNIPNFGQILMLTTSLIKAIFSSSFSHFPRRIGTLMTYILTTQYRLTPLTGKRHLRSKLLHNKEFEYALKFLKIRAFNDKRHMDTYEWWHHLYRQEQKPAERRGHHPHPPPHERHTPNRTPHVTT